jgi:hypothetical protein
MTYFLKSRGGNTVPVRPRPRAPFKKTIKKAFGVIPEAFYFYISK